MVDWVCIYMYTGEDSLGSNPELLIVHPKVTGGGGSLFGLVRLQYRKPDNEA